ncbi:MAG: CDP-alcohol phosphatidyltransferase family protein [Ruminococcus sp.]|uniref:CDP-alcohol phosphatidyltransferase family protein n=1 Tax=Ruminococcus sp. TaxID=41978 RepID=UPI001B1873DB|nr:CDP-alcohol phosphatidyltransferase family protein [Ruminococcus sp.]MBO4493074.1 CDP-alcohol phosphatidyltransferase family protein [Ruminococcus sp.]MBO7475174.1 CDP-alcohol phosphatidyltransferase family protein [Ruminococcus sp.]MBP5431813.1 CDP-alcohol phosphatidyltransferase family protein [Ruminococcus sp.]
MIGYYNYTVILTYISLISSMIGMLFAAGFGGMGDHPEYAIICLMVSGLCDMFDGKVARTKKDRTESEKKFGIQIDSLCDVICFGVLPSIIGYSVGMRDWCDLPVLLLFPLCAVIRLAYFNVAEEERQSKTSENRKVYEGLPVTSVALILPLLYSFHKDIGDWFPEVYGGSLLIIAIAFITRFKVKKPSMKTMLGFIGVGVLELIWMLYKTKTK